MKTIFKLCLYTIACLCTIACLNPDAFSITTIDVDNITPVTIMAAACLPVGSCSKTYAINGEDLEERTYGREDSAVLRALAYQDAVMLKNERYMTVIPDVKTKQRLSREDFKAPFKSKATGGRGKEDCGPFSGNGKYTDFNKDIVTYYMYNEVALCYKKLIRSWKQSQLRKGAGHSELNTTINDFILTNLIKNNNIQVDKLIWHGDYKSPTEELTHFDGLVKKLALGITAGAKHKVRYVFTGLASGDVIEGRVGGYDVEVPFNTDNNTTVGDLRTQIAALTNGFSATGLFTVTGATNQLIVEAKSNSQTVEIVLQVTDGSGLNSCDEAAEPGTGVYTFTELTAQNDADSPMTIAYANITASNVIDQMELIYNKINDENPALLNDPDFYVHVSSKVGSLINVAMTKTTGAFKGLAQIDRGGPFGLPIAVQPYLYGNVIAGFSAKNAFFGTDLLTDLEDIMQWIDLNCQEVRMRGEYMMGVEIGSQREVITNLSGHPFTFQPAAPTTGLV